MRPVKLFVSTNVSRPHEDRQLIGTGKFHQWGSEFMEFESGPGNYTVAIIELPDGTIQKYEPTMIEFDDQEEK